MSTHFPLTTDAPVTPGRKLRARIDVDDYVLLVPPYAVVRDWAAIGGLQQKASKDGSTITNGTTRFLNGIGWQLCPYQASIGNLHEKTILNDAIYASGSGMTVPSGFSTMNKWRDISGDVTGLGSPSAGTNSSGDPHYGKQPVTNADWSTTDYHIADSYGETREDWTYTADLVAKGTDPHIPGTGLILRVQETSFTLAAPSAHREFYFSAPASLENGIAGTGNYCVTFRGDGLAILCEHQPTNPFADSGGFVWVHEFRWATQNGAMAASHYFEVQSKDRPHASRGTRGVILFIVGTSGAAPGVGTGVLSGYSAVPSTDVFRYNVPYDASGDLPATTDQPFRLKSRRDQLHEWQISRAKYPTRGSLWDDPFTFPGNSYYLHDYTFTVFWYGDAPGWSGSPTTSVTINCYDRNSGFLGTTPMTPTATGIYKDASNNVWGGWAQYTVSSDLTDLTYQCEFVENGDGWTTPTIIRTEYQRPAITNLVSPGEISTEDFILTGPFDVQIQGQDTDTSHNECSFTIHDFDGDFAAKLGKHTGQCVVVDTEYPGVDWSDSANEGKQAVLFRGYISSHTKQLGGKSTITAPSGKQKFGDNLPGIDYSIYHLHCNGVWSRLAEAYAPFTYSFDFDRTVVAGVALDFGVPWKVTDVIRTILFWAGFPSQMVDIPDLDVRMWPKQDDQSSANTLSYGQNLMDFAQRIARDYLYRVLHFAENSGDGTDSTAWAGQWTLIKAPFSTYNDLFYLTRFGPSGGSDPSPTSPHMLGAYPVVTVGAQDQIGAPLFEWEERFRALTANHVTVAGATGINGNNNTPDVLICTMYNADSYDFDPRTPTSDPTSLDYVGRAIPLSYCDNLPTEEAVYTVCRILLNACRAGKIGSGRMPLILVTDTTDASQKRPRMLRIGDTGKVEGTRYMVRNCNPDISRKDTEQMAHVELELQREPL